MLFRGFFVGFRGDSRVGSLPLSRQAGLLALTGSRPPWAHGLIFNQAPELGVSPTGVSDGQRFRRWTTTG